MPTPLSNESKDDYIKRCMKYSDMQKYSQDQRLAICYDMWRSSSYPMGGTVDGRKGDHILLAPPFITTQNELHEIASRLRTAIDQVIAEVQPLEAAVHG